MLLFKCKIIAMSRMVKNVHLGNFNSALKFCVLNLTKSTIPYNGTLS